MPQYSDLEIGKAYYVTVNHPDVQLRFRDALVMIDPKNNETIWTGFSLSCPIEYVKFEKI